MPQRHDGPVAVEVQSEVGKLEAVILHRPGPEVSHMTPATAERALYSDILNQGVAVQEYDQFQGVLAGRTRTFFVRDLLADVVKDDLARATLIDRICRQENVPELTHALRDLEPAEVTRCLIEGVPLVRDNLTRFLSPERFGLPPLHNFFFTRDAAMVVGKRVLIGKMASKVRSREALIMEAIFEFHPVAARGDAEPGAARHRPPRGLHRGRRRAGRPPRRAAGGHRRAHQLRRPSTSSSRTSRRAPSRTTSWCRSCRASPSRSSTWTWPSRCSTATPAWSTRR